MSNNIPAPGFNNPQLRRYTPQDFQLSGVTTRGIPPPPAPFNQTDWVTPTRAKAAPQDFQLSGYTTRGIPPPAPFKQSDWPNPLRARSQPTIDTQIVTARQPIPRTPFPATPQEFFTYYARKPVAIADTVVNNLILAPSAITAPFIQTDWVTPNRPKYFNNNDIFPNSLGNGTYQNQVFRTFVVNNPQPKIKNVQVDPVPNSLILGIPSGVTVPPFAQTDWVTPTRAKAAPQDFQSGINATQGIRRTAFNQTDWPNPLRVRATPQDFQMGVIPPPPVVTAPFNNLDWQTPVKIRYYAQQEPISNQLGSGMLQNLVFRASSVNNPYPKVKVLQPDPVPNSLILGIPPAPFKPPFVQSDWANPVRAKANPQDYQISGTTTRGIPYIPPVVPKIFNFDWPNPRRAYDINTHGIQVSGSLVFNSPTTWSIIPPLPTTVWSPVNDFQSDALTADNTYVTADSTVATTDGYEGALQWVPISTNTTAWSPIGTGGTPPPIEGGVT